MMRSFVLLPAACLILVVVLAGGCRQPMAGQNPSLFGQNGGGGGFGLQGFPGANNAGIAQNGGVFGQPTGGGLFGFGQPQNGFGGGNQGGGIREQLASAQVAAQAGQLAGQVGSLSSRLNQFNSDNENLHAQIAALQQRLQNSNGYNDQLKQQLSDQMVQLQQTQIQMQQAQRQQQLAQSSAGGGGFGSYGNGNPALGGAAGNAGFQNPGLQNPYTQNPSFANPSNANGLPPINSNRQGGQVPSQLTSSSSGNAPTQFAGATLRANNGMMQKLQTVQLPGFKAWMDGDVIRIEGPTDRLFVSGTYQINQNDAMTLTSLASAIRQHFPRQKVSVEAHWDGSAIQPATTSHHQLTATQALAVFDLLVKSGLPNQQVFTMGMGSSNPRYQGSNPANRRIEIVIYPETF